MCKFSQMIRFCLFFSLVFQIFKVVAGILRSLPVRSVYSVCKLHHPQTPESKADQKEKWRLAPCLWSQRTPILFTGDSTDRTPSKPSLVTCVIKAVWHECWSLGALGWSESVTLAPCLCLLCMYTLSARWRQACSPVRYAAPHLIVFLLFDYLLDRRRAEPTLRKNWKSWDGMAVLSCSPHSGLVSKNWPPWGRVSCSTHAPWQLLVDLLIQILVLKISTA